jgi:hypothetical protein
MQEERQSMLVFIYRKSANVGMVVAKSWIAVSVDGSL